MKSLFEWIYKFPIPEDENMLGKKTLLIIKGPHNSKELELIGTYQF